MNNDRIKELVTEAILTYGSKDFVKIRNYVDYKERVLLADAEIKAILGLIDRDEKLKKF
jgi:hypothetical protein